MKKVKYAPHKNERMKLIALCIKAVTGVAGGSLILAEGHPYLTLTILCIGAVANEITNFLSVEKSTYLNGSDSAA